MNTTPNTRGKLIIIEGADGSGKSTVTTLISGALQQQGKKVQAVNILKDSPISKDIRGLLTSPDKDMHPDTEACLYVGAILNTYWNVIVPLLEDGTNVICDRSHISCWAYQIFPQLEKGNLIPSKIFDAIRSVIRADVLCMLFVDPQRGLERVKARDGALDRIELRGPEYQAKVQEGFVTYLKDENRAQHTLEFHNNDSREELFSYVKSVINLI